MALDAVKYRRQQIANRRSNNNKHQSKKIDGARIEMKDILRISALHAHLHILHATRTATDRRRWDEEAASDGKCRAKS